MHAWQVHAQARASAASDSCEVLLKQQWQVANNFVYTKIIIVGFYDNWFLKQKKPALAKDGDASFSIIDERRF